MGAARDAALADLRSRVDEVRVTFLDGRGGQIREWGRGGSAPRQVTAADGRSGRLLAGVAWLPISP
eukprot:gene33868-62578_t